MSNSLLFSVRTRRRVLFPEGCQNVVKVLRTVCYVDDAADPHDIPLWSVQCEREAGHTGKHETWHPSVRDETNEQTAPWRWV